MSDKDLRTHEVTFCSRVSKWADSLFEGNPSLPFRRTEIEESKGINRKRSDLRVYDAKNKLILAGEVKSGDAWHRIQFGKHYPTDIYAGRVLAFAIYRQLKANPDFQRDFAAAKAELTAAAIAHGVTLQLAPAAPQPAPVAH